MLKFNKVTAALCLLLWAVQSPAQRETTLKDNSCDCGPDYCLGNSRYSVELEAKKTALKNKGFSSDLIALLDRDGHCVAAVEQAPATFSIKRQVSGTWTTEELNDEREQYAKADIINGVATAYYKFNVSRALACCGEPKYDQRPDWNDDLDRKSVV